MKTIREWAGDTCPICHDTWGGASQCRPKWSEVLDTVACTDCAEQAEREQHLDELRGSLECEIDLHGETSEMAMNLVAAIAAIELELGAK